MTGYLPPARPIGTPYSHHLPAGTRLYRVHETRFQSTDFNPTPQDANFDGFRFDGTEADPYAYYYAALTMHTALAESLVRSLPFKTDGLARLVPEKAYKDRYASVVRLTRPVTLLSLLSTVAQNAVGQTGWIVDSSEDDYGKTRRWAQWLREHADWADGLVWMSHHDVPHESLVLFGDRCQRSGTGPILEADPDSPSIRLDEEAGMQWAEQELSDYFVLLRRDPRH